MNSIFMLYGIVFAVITVITAHPSVEPPSSSETARDSQNMPPKPPPYEGSEIMGPSNEDSMEDHLNSAMEIGEFIQEKQGDFVATQHENAVFVLGPYKSGKTTLLNFLTKDNSKLSAVNSVERGMEIQYQKNYSPNSEIFPQIYTDDNTYIKLPSLKYADDFAKDFAAGYFNKETFNNVTNIKIVLVFPYSNQFFNATQPEIINVFRHTANLIRDIRKLKDSVSIVITKVNTKYGNEILSDKDFKQKVAEYLILLKDVNQIGMFYKAPLAKIKILLDYLTAKDDNAEYKNIALFKVPSKEGSLSEDFELQNEKKEIKLMINDKLQFSKIQPNDVRYIAYSDYRKYLVFRHFERIGWITKFFSFFMESGSLVKLAFTFFQLDD